MKHIKVSLLILILSVISKDNVHSEPIGTELVMPEGSVILAKTHLGEIKIKANGGLERIYTWDGASRKAELKPRKTRWFGSFGAYSPGRGFHWEENHGILRGVLEEGQQHFNSLDEAIAWLKLPYHSNCVYRDDGLAICYSKNIKRFQLNVSIWQIYIEGSKPLNPPESAGDRIWFYDPEKKPEAFKNSENKKYFLGGKKTINIPGSCNDCISFFNGSELSSQQ